jgi:hypothetical protein
MSFFSKQAEPFLPDADFLAVALPTADLQVLSVLARERDVLRRYSRLTTVLSVDDDVPAGDSQVEVARDQPTADVRRAASQSVKIGVGMNLLASLLQLLGGQRLGIELAAQHAATVNFGYADVVTDRVDLGSLDAWLARADLSRTSRAAADLLAAEAMYVVVGTLKARALTATFLDSADRKLALDVPVIADAVGGTVSVQAADEASTTVTFRGDTALVVAAKAAQIKLDAAGTFWVNDRLMTRGEIRGLGRPPVAYLKPGSGVLEVG